MPLPINSRPYSYDEKSVDPIRDIQDDESPVVIQHKKHLVEHESAEEDDVCNIHD